MRTKSFAFAAALLLPLSGAAFAQTAAGGGSATGNMNNPGSVKSDSEKGAGSGMSTMPADTTGTTGRSTGNMGGGTGSSANTGVGTGNQGANQGAR